MLAQIKKRKETQPKVWMGLYLSGSWARVYWNLDCLLTRMSVSVNGNLCRLKEVQEIKTKNKWIKKVREKKKLLSPCWPSRVTQIYEKIQWQNSFSKCTYPYWPKITVLHVWSKQLGRDHLALYHTEYIFLSILFILFVTAVHFKIMKGIIKGNCLLLFSASF